MEFEKSADTKILENVLGGIEVGQLVTYEELSSAIGRDVRKHARSSLGTARRGLLSQKGFVFGVELNVGLIRLCDSDIIKSTERDRVHLQRTAKRSLKKLTVVKFDGLSADEKRAHIVASAQIGTIAMFAAKTSAKKIESRVTTDSKALPIGDTLKLFG